VYDSSGQSGQDFVEVARYQYASVLGDTLARVGTVGADRRATHVAATERVSPTRLRRLAAASTRACSVGVQQGQFTTAGNRPSPGGPTTRTDHRNPLRVWLMWLQSSLAVSVRSSACRGREEKQDGAGTRRREVPVGCDARRAEHLESAVRVPFVRALLAAMVLTMVTPLTVTTSESVPEVVAADVELIVPAATTSLSRTGTAAPQWRRSAPVAAPMAFTMIGIRLPEGVDAVRVRAATDDGRWGPWYDLERVGRDDGPDPGTAEAAVDRSRGYTDPVYVGAASRLQLETPAGVDEDLVFSAGLLDTEGLSRGALRRSVRVTGPVAEASTAAPAHVTRAGWGAVAPKTSVSYASKVDLTVVHHTAGNNDYTPAQAPGIVRGIQRWHMDNNGWNDIGYNALIDRFGTIYEGRAGGFDRGVVGAHAAGYNTGSFGVAVLGNFEKVDAPQAAYDALARVIGWKSALHGMDPLGTTTREARGTKLRTVSGHQDAGLTACPGLIQNRLGWIRTEAAKQAAATSPAPSPSPSPTPNPDDARFPDVGSTNPHRANVLTVHDANVLLGYQDNTFKPGVALNRGDMARAVARSMGLAPAPWDDRFSDVPQGHWLAPWVLALHDAGIVHGYSDGTFRMAEPLRRDQMATFLARSLRLQRAEPSFDDVPASNVHRGSIGAVERAGITRGISATEYGPAQTMRRDQSASLLVQAYDLPR
jgi:hypothetical protein